MSKGAVPKQPIVDALAAVWSSTRELLAGLDGAEWTAPSPLPGWDVRANVAHMIGTEAMLLGIDPPQVDTDVTALPHVKNDMGAVNERWVIAMADKPPAEMLERFTNYTAQRLEALQAMGPDEWDADSWTPTGPGTYSQFMQIRVLDNWAHEQDIRDAVGQPGHESGIAVDTVLGVMRRAMGFVVAKQAGAPAGSRVTYTLTGDAGRDIHVEVGDRGAAVDELSGPATVTLIMLVGTFVRLGFGRITHDAARQQIDVEGDQELADRLIDNGAYMF